MHLGVWEVELGGRQMVSPSIHSVIKLSEPNVNDVLLYHMCFLAEASAQTCRHPSLCAASFTITPH